MHLRQRIVPAQHTTLNKHELAIMDCIHALGGSVTFRQISNALKVSVSVVQYRIQRMIEKGAVEKIMFMA